MKSKTFLAINLNDFHNNQNGEARTNCEIVFISAKSIVEAKNFVSEFYPTIAWFVIPKKYCDQNIVCSKTIELK
jgi:hypothetical protein